MIIEPEKADFMNEMNSYWEQLVLDPSVVRAGQAWVVLSGPDEEPEVRIDLEIEGVSQEDWIALAKGFAEQRCDAVRERGGDPSSLKQQLIIVLDKESVGRAFQILLPELSEALFTPWDPAPLKDILDVGKAMRSLVSIVLPSFWDFVNRPELTTTEDWIPILGNAFRAVGDTDLVWKNCEDPIRRLHWLARGILEDLEKGQVWKSYLDELNVWLQQIPWGLAVAGEPIAELDSRDLPYDLGPPPPEGYTPIGNRCITGGPTYSLQQVREGQGRFSIKIPVASGEINWTSGLLEKTVRKLRLLLLEGAKIQRCETPTCKKFFPPWRKDQKYCTEFCGRRERARQAKEKKRKTQRKKRRLPVGP